MYRLRRAKMKYEVISTVSAKWSEIEVTTVIEADSEEEARETYDIIGIVTKERVVTYDIKEEVFKSIKEIPSKQ